MFLIEKIKNKLISFFGSERITPDERRKVGLLLIATGKYDIFIQPLINSAEKWFLKNHDVTYFIFTDTKKNILGNNIVKIFHEHKPFPYPTLFRYNTFVKNIEFLTDMEYLFYCDIDMLFVDSIGSEILSDRVLTQHPGYYGKRGTPETNPESLAFVPDNVDMQYFAGGFNGGTTKEFLKMAQTIDENIQKDLEKDIIAIWHDESHLNRYAIDNPPTKILDPGYCYGESMKIPFKKRLIALDKNHQALRT